MRGLGAKLGYKGEESVECVWGWSTGRIMVAMCAGVGAFFFFSLSCGSFQVSRLGRGGSSLLRLISLLRSSPVSFLPLDVPGRLLRRELDLRFRPQLRHPWEAVLCACEASLRRELRDWVRLRLRDPGKMYSLIPERMLAARLGGRSAVVGREECGWEAI